MTRARRCALLPASLALAGCQTSPPLPTAGTVDLERFMGDWYVIASIQTPFEKGAHNAVESHRLDRDGTVATTFTFRKDAFDGPQRVMRPRGFVRDTRTNATWGMQFVWPFKSEYVIAHVDPGYTETIIARTRRDYVWIMARSPTLASDDYARLARRVQELGYDAARLQQVPQRG